MNVKDPLKKRSSFFSGVGSNSRAIAEFQQIAAGSDVMCKISTNCVKFRHMFIKIGVENNNFDMNFVAVSENRCRIWKKAT